MNWIGKLLLALVAVVLLYLGARLLIAHIQPAPSDLDAFGGQLRPCADMPNCVHSQSNDERHAIAPLAYADTAAAAHDRLIALLNELPRTLVVTDQPGYIHATVTSWGWGYLDDIEFLIGEGAVQVRSGARLPYYDFNANRKRVEALRAQWQALTP